MKPPEGGLILISDLPEGALTERGAYLKNQGYIWKLFSSFNPYFAESTYNVTAQIHKFDTVFIPNHIKINLQGCVAK